MSKRIESHRREVIKASLAAGAGLGLGALGLGGLARTARAASPGTPPPKPARKKALFIWGGWPGHQPDRCRDIFVPWLKSQSFDVVVSDKLDVYADGALMKTIDLIVQIWTMGTIKGDQLKGLLEAVKNGTGIAGWHGGLGDAFRQETEYQFMIGGQWVSHPGNIIDYRVNITDSEDPITAGLSDFTLRSELYYMQVDPNNKVLATTSFNADHAPWIDGATMPVVWKRSYGKGRVFYSSMGHNVNVFDVPECMTITQRGLLWASESKYARTPDLVSPMYPAR